MEEEIKYLYIYNIEQCSFYMQHECRPVDIGVNEKTKMVWCKFIKQDTLEVYLLWLKRCKARKIK